MVGEKKKDAWELVMITLRYVVQITNSNIVRNADGLFRKWVPLILYVMYLQTVFEDFIQPLFMDILIENSVDSLQISTLRDSREMRQRYEKHMFKIFFRKGAVSLDIFRRMSMLVLVFS